MACYFRPAFSMKQIQAGSGAPLRQQKLMDSMDQWTDQFLAASQMPNQSQINNGTWMPPQYDWQWINGGSSYYIVYAPMPHQQQQYPIAIPQQQQIICPTCLQNLEIAKDANAWGNQQNGNNSSHIGGIQNGQHPTAEMILQNFENAEGHIKRPMNYERAKILRQHPEMNNPEICQEAGQRWKKLPNDGEQKQWYFQRAKELAQQHHLMYPHYKFSPKRKAKKGLEQPTTMQMQ